MLANGSVDSLSTSQLSAMRAELRRTLRTVEHKIEENEESIGGGSFWMVQHSSAAHSCFPEGEKDASDRSDWSEDESKHQRLSQSPPSDESNSR